MHWSTYGMHVPWWFNLKVMETYDNSQRCIYKNKIIYIYNIQYIYVSCQTLLLVHQPKELRYWVIPHASITFALSWYFMTKLRSVLQSQEIPCIYCLHDISSSGFSFLENPHIPFGLEDRSENSPIDLAATATQTSLGVVSRGMLLVTWQARHKPPIGQPLLFTCHISIETWGPDIIMLI